MHPWSKTALNSRSELVLTFQHILQSPEACEQALTDPASVFERYGLNVPDPAATNEVFYQVVPQIKAHFASVAQGGTASHEPLLGCDSPGCIACKAGLGISLAGLLPIAIAGGAAAAGAVAAIAGIVGLSEATVAALIAGAASGGIGSCIDSLCDAMGAC